MAALYVDSSRSNLHLSGDYNLNSVDGVRDALAELDGVRRALVRRGQRIEAGEDVEDLGVEEPADNWDDELESWSGFSPSDEDEE
jgi:hypothetical protein